MRAPHIEGWTRRRFLGGLTWAGMVGFLGLTPRRVAAEPPPEATRLRVMQGLALCEAPIQVAQERLRGEGFSDVQYIRVSTSSYEPLASGEIDLALHKHGQDLLYLSGEFSRLAGTPPQAVTRHWP